MINMIKEQDLPARYGQETSSWNDNQITPRNPSKYSESVRRDKIRYTFTDDMNTSRPIIPQRTEFSDVMTDFTNQIPVLYEGTGVLLLFVSSLPQYIGPLHERFFLCI